MAFGMKFLFRLLLLFFCGFGFVAVYWYVTDTEVTPSQPAIQPAWISLKASGNQSGLNIPSTEVHKIQVTKPVAVFNKLERKVWESKYSNLNTTFRTSSKEASEIRNLTSSIVQSHRKIKEIILAVVACGDRLNETLIMLKSSMVFTKVPLKFIIFADDDLIPVFHQRISLWPEAMKEKATYGVHPITFPLQGDAREWRKLFKPCAAQRLFLPTVLKDVDALLYVDTDVLFLSPLEDIWQHFYKMNSSQMAALSPEHEDHATGWYNRFARHPYYEPLGVNSGVMLMNLTRMRRFGWHEYVVPIYKEYKMKITWGDQDIINIIFHFHPDKLYVYPCNYNFRPDHCMYMSVCKSAEEEGVVVLHGNRGSFHNDKQVAFKAVYNAIERYEIGSSLKYNLLIPLKDYLEVTKNTNCGKIGHVFTKHLEKYIAR